MVQARSPCGAEWVRESRPEQSQDPVGGAGSSPLQGGARSLAATPVARQSGVRPEPDPTRVVPRSVFTPPSLLGRGFFAFGDNRRGEEAAMIQAVTAGSDMRGRSERWATRPSRDEVAAIASQANDIRAVPIFREVMADLETAPFLRYAVRVQLSCSRALKVESDWLATPLSARIRSRCSRCEPGWRR